ncbi:MAG: palindromic element RPE1 domain-containing protein [Candidatus Tisiphia sp.]
MRLPAEFAFAEEFVGDTKPRPAAYSNVREEQSTGITHKLPAKVELCRKSITDRINIHHKTQLLFLVFSYYLFQYLENPLS